MAMTVIGIILIVAAVFLVVAVLMQHGKSHNLSGTIAGASETFFGKSKSSTIDRKLQVITTIVAIVFVVLVLVAYLIQDVDLGSAADTTTAGTTAAVTTTAGTTADTTATGAESADPAESTAAETTADAAESASEVASDAAEATTAA